MVIPPGGTLLWDEDGARWESRWGREENQEEVLGG